MTHYENNEETMAEVAGDAARWLKFRRDVAPTLEEAQAFVRGLVEVLAVPHPKTGEEVQLIINEEGKLEGWPVNLLPTLLWQSTYDTDDVIVGPVMMLVGDARWD